jgi:hypothetical protein
VPELSLRVFPKEKHAKGVCEFSKNSEGLLEIRAKFPSALIFTFFGSSQKTTKK